ncbi:S41 family peptidase [Cohnella zeiphila]|nr:S41 family peptidase [Cohnella zeiphila]
MVLLSSFLAGTAYAADASSTTQTEEVRKLLEEYHLSKPTDDELNDAAIQGMVDSLHDPYTEYFTADQWKDFQDYMEQTYVGVGIVLTEDSGLSYVQDVIPSGPAAKAGVKPGDRIVSIGGQSVQGKSFSDLNGLLIGQAGTSVTVVLNRDGARLTVKLARSDVQLPIATSSMMPGGIGYLTLSAFSSDAAAKFGDELAKLEKIGLCSLIIDLRDNGGGYIDQAQKIAQDFVASGVLAHMTDRDGKDHPLELQGTAKSYPIYVLVNGNTASASELLSGALQDYGAAKLIGTKTYGKGVVQQILNVPSGGVLKVTIEEYYTPNGHKVDHKGLTPDQVVHGAAEQLIAAYRAAGGQSLTLTAGKGSVTVNGVRTGQSAVVRASGKPFLNLRLAAAFSGATVQYDAATRTILFARGGQIVRIPVAGPSLQVENGVSYVDVKQLAQWVPAIAWSDSAGTIVLNLKNQ